MRDSAGIRIVENIAPVGPLPWLDSIPSFIIEPGQPGAPEFYSPISAVRLSDGRIVAAGWAMTDMHLFDAEGRWQQTIGRRGSGPGEFEGLGWVYRMAGDTLLTFEPGAQRLQRWRPDGTHLSLALLVSPPGRSSATLRRPFADGALLLVVPTPAPDESTDLTFRDQVTLFRTADAGAPWDSILTYLGAPSLRSVENPQWSWGRPLFTPAPSADIHEDGIAFSPGDRFEVRFFDLEGRLRTIARRQVPPRPVSAAELNEAVAQWGQSMSPERRERMRPRVRQTATYRTHPPIGVIRSLTDGRLWVESGGTKLGERIRASIFHRDGRWQGDVVLPTGFQMLQVDGDGVLGFRSGEDGFYRLEFYRLTER